MLKLIAVLLLLTAGISGQSPYCGFSPQHTLCLHREGQTGPSCGVVSHRAVSRAEMDTIVDTHNRLRSSVAMGTTGHPQPSAGNMMELSWDPELARVAQTLADQCVFSHECSDCRRVERFSVGQNLYQSSSSRPGDLSREWSQAIGSWFSEISQFPASSVERFVFSPATGHYSQLVWAATTKVGCGVVEHVTGRFLTRLFVCNYGRGGNFISAPVYQSGPACSSCPSVTTCSNRYPGLCTETSSSNQPQSPPPPPPPPPARPPPESQSAPVFFPQSNRPVQPAPVLFTGVLSPNKPSSSSSTPTCSGNSSFFCLLRQPARMVETAMASAHHMTHMMMDGMATVASVPRGVMSNVPAIADFPNFFFSNLFGK